MKAVPRAVIVALLAAALAASAAAAADAPPGSRIELGFEERVRTENWDNVTDFDADVLDARHQVRFRTRAWARLFAGAHTEFAVGLNNESRKVTTPGTPMTMDETVFETLTLERRFPHGFSMRLGRQDLNRGDGFLLMDGGPLDGSRTAYFNALDVAWTRERARLDLFLVSNPDRDQYLPPIRDQHKPMVEWDERAAGLTWSDAGHPGTTWDLYYFYKSQTDDTRPPASPAHLGDRWFHTLGGRLVSALPREIELLGEFAGQGGRQGPDAHIVGWGAQASAKKSFGSVAWKPAVLLGWVGLSGDDPGTADHEGWDPLFSRWPKWSEAYVYTLGSEQGPGTWTNLSMWLAEVQVAPADPVDVRVVYRRLAAFEPFPGPAALYATGTGRCDFFAARANLRVGDHWRGHVTGEWLAPGDFYAGDDPGWFFRVELTCSLRHVLAL